MKNTETKAQHHCVCIPYPTQGHITPMFHLAKLLHATNNFHITFINTHHNHRRLLRTHGPSSLSSLPSFNFHSIPDGLPPASNPDATQPIHALGASLIALGDAPFRAMLSTLGSESPPVSCVVADSAMAFAVGVAGVAEEAGLRVAMLWTPGASCLMGYAQFERLVRIGMVPILDSESLSNGYLDKVVEGIESMEGITLKHLPSFIRTTDPNDSLIKININRVSTISSSPFPLIFNTFLSLDHPTLQALSSSKITNSPPFSIGPLSLLAAAINNESDHLTFRSSLLPEDPCCVAWLDTKPPNSVVYVNFGSIATLTHDQVTQIGWGLVNSNQNFLWIMRPDLVGEPGSGGAKTQELVGGSQGRGMLASWCEQEKVLAHPAVGGFLTHCGWNSTIEAIAHGVPVVCWPFFGDQMTNCWFCCEKWGIGVEIGGGGEVRKEEVERVVRELLEGDKGEERRKNSTRWKSLAEEAVKGPNGSSYLSFGKLVDYLMGA